MCAGKAPDEKLQIGAIKFLTIGAPFSVKTPSRWGNQISISIKTPSCSHHPPNKEVVGITLIGASYDECAKAVNMQVRQQDRYGR